ncbi:MULTISPECIES: GNAT family N-acetyltransferase [Aquimarina]|uniref:GNAT family N-acetyltransferase n=1 Tax=Aquimarina TaxID=290174 RepID=UPI001F3D526B|nr:MULTISPECIES: GNAT family N-acetyltransferase [Aquimarina]
MRNWIETLELIGENVKLIPMKKSHKNSLLQAASDGKLWELWFTSVPSANNIDNYVETALTQKQNGIQFPFVVIDRKSRKVIGSTRYCNIDYKHRRLEIGYTWYAKKHQKTGVNTECKTLFY